MIKFTSFINGLSLGAIAGAAISFLTDPQTGQPIQKEIKHLVNETNSDIKNISSSTQSAQSSLDELQNHALPQAKLNIASLERSIKEFQYNTKPTLNNIKTSLDKLSADSKNIK